MATKTAHDSDTGAARGVEEPETGSPSPLVAEVLPRLDLPGRVAVDAIFQRQLGVRQAITENLRARQVEAGAVAARVEKAFETFHPSRIADEELARRHHIAPGADPTEAVETVIVERVDEVRAGGVEPRLTLVNRGALKELITESGDDGSEHGTIDLGRLVDRVTALARGGSTLATDPTVTTCRAAIEAQRIVDEIEAPPPPPPPGGEWDEPAVDVGGNGDRAADRLVADAVTRQMAYAGPPEAQVRFSAIPNGAAADPVQRGIVQTFELRPGASDVTSYHDFHTLQIAFAHVWTEIFDGELAWMGRQLYREYVQLKDYAGSADPDLQISTLDDLKRLMDEIKRLSQTMEDDLPADLRGNADPGAPTRPNDVNDVAETVLEIVINPMAAVLRLIIQGLSDLGKKPRVYWRDFPGPLPGRADEIEVTFEKNVAPVGKVYVALTAADPGRWKGIEFQEYDREGRLIYRAMVSNNRNDPGAQYPGGPSNLGQIELRTAQVASGLIEFDSQEHLHKSGRYYLADLEERLEDGMRVTFNWTKE